MLYPIISSEILRKIISTFEQGLKEINISLDLDFSEKKFKVEVGDGFFVFNKIKFEIPKIRADDKSCYLLLEDSIEKVQYVSENGIYKLIPTQFRPILQISGTSMHKQSFIERVEKDKLYGNILDSGTGLGYTAIVASKTCSKVFTIEVDKMVSDIQKINPYSQELFNNKKIELLNGDLVEKIKKFRDTEFNFLILDGGTPKSSGDFFSLENYQEAFRVLKRGGKLYHYVPNYHVNRGEDFAERISRYLKKAGFKKIDRDEEGSYLIAWK